MSVINESIVLKSPGLPWLQLHSGMPLREVLPLILKTYIVDAMKIGLIIYLEFSSWGTGGERDSEYRESFAMVRDVFRSLCLSRRVYRPRAPVFVSKLVNCGHVK
jgi:hypothetical protein